MLCTKSGVKIAQMHEAVNEEPRTDEQNERDRDFGDHERAAESFAARTCVGIAAALFEGVVQIKMRRLTRWRQAKNQTGNECDEQGEAEHSCVDRDRVGLGYVGWNAPRQDAQTCIGQTEPHYAAS